MTKPSKKMCQECNAKAGFLHHFGIYKAKLFVRIHIDTAHIIVFF